jgi:hypothetical protein
VTPTSPHFRSKQTSAEALKKDGSIRNTGFESFYSWQIIVFAFSKKRMIPHGFSFDNQYA